MRSSKAADWTKYDGEPVYWLAPEFWNPKTGVVTLVLPGEDPRAISTAQHAKRIAEFHVLQGDPRYCSPETARRMRRLMRERLGTNTPWRDVVPRNAQTAETPEGFPSAELPF